ncbi:MAG: phosphoadenosine phosphosulfate reductase family protein [Thermoprotei archaeon]
MLEIIVRSRRDASAIEAMIKRFYSDWELKVHILHGARRVDDALRELEDIVEKDKFYVLLLGREDENMANELDEILPPNIAVHIVPRAKIRNTRIEHLAHEFDVARSKLRLAVHWSSEYDSFIFSLRSGELLENYEYNPAYDIFLGLGKGYSRVLRELLGNNICENPLLVRKFSGVHDVYCGKERVAVLEIPDEGFKPSGKLLSESSTSISLDKLLEANKRALELYERISTRFLERFREWADTVIIPWSGGKDSTATLLLALKVFPRSRVRVLFSDTGTEFPWTHEYVEEVSQKLGISIERVYAGVDRGILVEGKPMPTHDNRWCTGRKIASVTLGIEKLSEGNTLVVVGDRDAESRRRSIRPPIRRVDDKTLIVSPIKLWSAAHVQLYILWKGFKLNPLYERGFYRIGCYICPALRSWELYIMNTDPAIRLRLQQYPLYTKFIEHRLKNSRSSRSSSEFYCDMLSICG